ncbi:MAG: Hsp70 family protein [Clostridium sp.]
MLRGKIARGINPDEVVALGAAVQASINSGVERRIILMDNSNHSLGVEVLDGKFDIIIPRDSKLPAEKSKGYITVNDNQSTVDIRVYQGEGINIAENTCIGYLRVTGIPKKPKGYERVDITFKYDLNGMLRVSAKVLSTKEESIIEISLLGDEGEKKAPVKKMEEGVKPPEIIEEPPVEIKEEEVPVINEEVVQKEEQVVRVEVEEVSQNGDTEGFDESLYEEIDEQEIYRDTSQLVSIINSTIEQYQPEGQKILRDKLGDLLTTVKGGDLRAARRIQLEIVSLLDV